MKATDLGQVSVWFHPPSSKREGHHLSLSSGVPMVIIHQIVITDSIIYITCVDAYLILWFLFGCFLFCQFDLRRKMSSSTLFQKYPVFDASSILLFYFGKVHNTYSDFSQATNSVLVTLEVFGGLWKSEDGEFLDSWVTEWRVCLNFLSCILLANTCLLPNSQLLKGRDSVLWLEQKSWNCRDWLESGSWRPVSQVSGHFFPVGTGNPGKSPYNPLFI